MITFKKLVFNFCEQHITEKISYFQQAISNAQESANEEGKSSAGDKYETGRAMMQLEIEKNTTHLAEAFKLKETLYKVEHTRPKDCIDLGSLIKTNLGYYYIAISIGAEVIEQQKVFIISAGSPIGKALLGKKENDSIQFNNLTIFIEAIF